MKRAYLYILISVLSTDLLFGAILTGRTEGSFSVSSSGAASYSIPITIQKGLSDFIPNISLSYNSQVGNGIAGLGWNVSGLSSISIAPRTPYFDGHSEAIYKGEDNVFVLDGMRLLLTSGTNGMTGATYRTESEQYSIISITGSSNGTPQTFQVRASDGSTYRYGSTTGRYQTPDGETYGWALDYAEDALGNFISYNYSQEGILYPTSISYGHNVHGTNGVDCTITFNYESRPDSIPSYLFGFQTYFKKRLKNIVCKYNGNTYRTYTLNYTEDTYSRLASVTEAGTSTSTLRPTTFEWNVPQFQVNCGSRSMETALLENMDDEDFFSGDLDGDGITEIISIGTRNGAIGGSSWPYITFYGRKWNPGNQRFDFCYSAQTQSGISAVELFGENVASWISMYSIRKLGGLVMHATHGEGNTLVFPYCQTDEIKAFRVNIPDRGWNYNLPLKGMSNDLLPYMILDADKDGLDEIFVVETDKYGDRYPAYLVKFNLTTETSSCTEFSLDLQGKPDKVRCADFNCDGMPDLLITTSAGYYIYWNRTGSFSDSDRLYGTTFGKCDVLETGDFNGDGLPDLIINDYHSTWWYTAINTGNESGGYFSLNYISYLSQSNTQHIEGRDNQLYCIVVDLDGDGRSDAVVGYPYGNGDGGRICILRSESNTLVSYGLHDFTSTGNFPDNTHVVVGNLDGHGRPQIMYYGKALTGTAVGWHLLDNPTVQASSQKIVSITDGLGARDSIGYGMLSDSGVYTVTRHHSFPLVRLAGSMPVVTSRTESIPTDSRTTTYSYANGVLHLHGKGFLGFEDIWVESSTGIVTKTHSELDSTFYVLLPHTTTQSTVGGATIKRERNFMCLQSAGGRSYTTEQSSRVLIDSLTLFMESEGNYEFENGYPTSHETYDDMLFSFEDITYWESPLDNVRIMGLPAEVETTKTGSGITGDDISERITYQRDPSTGQVLKETRWRDGLLVSTDGYSYNEYGQMTRHYTVPYSSTDTLVTTWQYNTKGQLVTETEPKGLTKTYSYNSQYGTLSLVVDFDGVRTTFTYDGMLRETYRRTPIETLQTSRAMSSYGGGTYYVRKNRTGEAPVTTYYDYWNRKVAEVTPLANGTPMYTDYSYLPNGQVGFISFPHRSYETASEGTTYTYDSAHRRTSAVDTNGKTSTWSYGPGSQITSTIDGITTETFYYTPDKVHVVEDDSGWLEYFYNADGNVSIIDNYDLEASYSYDAYGRLIQTTDMNGVTKQYSYDAVGNPYRTTIGGSIVETNYDKFGILRSKSWTDPGDSTHTVTYSYDSRFRLIREAGSGYLDTYSYDTYGRMTHKNRRINGSGAKILYKSFQYSGPLISSVNAYFSATPPETILQESFAYQNGYNVADTLNHCLVWSLTSQDRWGNVTRNSDLLGYTTHTFDDYGNMLTMKHYGTTYLSESYTYDVGTGNMSSKNNVSLSYDSMNRLTGWGNYNYSYDDNGNITHQPFVGDFSYNGYKVTDMTAEDSLLFGDSLHISYYKAIERPKCIENDTYKAKFYYDGNGDRIMMELFERHAAADSLVFTRYYLDANAEVTKDTLGHCTHLYYVGGDAYTASAVMVLDETGNYDIYQIIRDNLGSVLMYEDSTGIRYRYTYSPWGVRTHSGGSNDFYRPGEEPGFGPFYRTYTGHEDLWMFGLLNANARLYSPYLGRFVSPDPLLTEDGSPLDFNPYVYARNNPYRYIDRNGEFWWLAPILIGAAVNAATYSISAAITGNWDVGSFFKSMGIGAITSALGIGTSLLSTQLGQFGQSFTYGLLSNMSNNAITNAIFGEKMSFADIPGIFAGAVISSVLPTFSPTGTNVFKNVISELGFNTLRGSIIGSASGSVNALVHDDFSLVWKGAVGGGISGFSRTLLDIAIFGAAYQPLDENDQPISYGTNGLYRKGGLAGYVMNKMNREGNGITLGRQSFTVENSKSLNSVISTRFHENFHLQQIKRMGLAKFYGEIVRQYLKYGFGKGPLEDDAYKYERDNM